MECRANQQVRSLYNFKTLWPWHWHWPWFIPHQRCIEPHADVISACSSYCYHVFPAEFQLPQLVGKRHFFIFAEVSLVPCEILPVVQMLLDRPFCVCFSSVNSLSPTSVNRLAWNFSTWRGFSPIGSAAMPISWKCPLTKMRGKNPKFFSISHLTATY